LIAAVVLLGSPAGAAVGNNQQPDPAIAAALRRIADKTFTPADITLIKKYPEIAAQVPDPTRAPVVSRTKAPAAGARAAAGAGCTGVNLYVEQYTMLGYLHWRWVHHLSWCYEPGRVVSLGARYDALVASDFTVYMKDLMSDSVGPVPAPTVTSFKQRQLEYCAVKYGCYDAGHPWSAITAYPGNFAATWSWGIG
jgi:hypothetical protein